MLVLTRKELQRIQIGDNITITVVRVQGNKVRIGIDAPADLPICREEILFDATPAENDAGNNVAAVVPAPEFSSVVHC